MNSFPANHRIPKLPILMYHSVSEISERSRKIRTTNPAYSLTVNQFRQQMEYLYNNGYKTIHLNQLLDINAQVPQKSLVITFDDGWADNYTNVFPILKEYGLTATIFIITGSMGQSNYMNWNQLRKMSDAGISIQSHTVSHKPLAQLSKTEVEYELETSKKTIEDRLGNNVSNMSFPHGIFDKGVIGAAQRAGYQAVSTSEPGYEHTHECLPVLKRINIADRCQITTFEKIVQRNQMIITQLLLSKKIKNFARKVVGHDNYRKIYQLRYHIKD